MTVASDIQISGLHKSFADVVALHSLDLTIAEGEMFGLIGPDGAGKTTLLRILCGLIDADKGECLLGGKNVRSESRAARAQVGYMPQKFSLYPDLTVAENLRFFADLYHVRREERQQRQQRLLEFSRLGPFSRRRASALSGGMKQKLALSCTLIHTPRILLLDEPTTGVDPVSRCEFWQILQELHREGGTILVTTPYMEEAARCDHIALIHKGKLLVKSAPGALSSLFNGILMEVDTADHLRAAEILRQSGRFPSVQIFGTLLHVTGAETPSRMRERIEEILGREGIVPHSCRIIEPSLEDVFIELLT
jgi:ABC-2 type transport system ATP-binding protein